MERFLPPVLFERAVKASKAILARIAGAGTTEGVFYYPLSHKAGGMPLMYFNDLSLEDQKKHVEGTQSIAELVHILESDTTLRGLALDRLLATPQGRVLALGVYVRSDDPRLLELVESRNWKDDLRSDVMGVKDSVVSDMFRRAMAKMYARTGQEWALNLRLADFSYPELHLAQDPRGSAFIKAEIDLLATRMALDFIEQTSEHELTLWAGHAIYTPAELDLLKLIRVQLRQSNDPRDVRAFLDGLRQRQDPDVKKLLEKIIERRDAFANGIAVNSHDVPTILLTTKILIAVTGALVAAFSWYAFHGVSPRAKIEDMVKSLRKDLISEDKAMTNDDTDGIVIPISREIEDKFRTPLERWRKQVLDLANDDIGAEDMLFRVNSILNRAFELIRLTKYRPQVMWNENRSPIVLNQNYQMVLNHFNLLAIDTLQVLRSTLKDRKLSEHERERLLSDIDALVEAMEYVTVYLHFLEYRGLVDKVMGDKFDDDHWAERSGLYPLMRWFLLYKLMLKTSEKGLARELPVLLARGNELMPNLYPQSDDIIQQSRLLLETTVKRGHQLFAPGSKSARNNLKMSSFLRRVRMMSVPFVLTLLVAGSFAGFYGLGATLSVGGILGIAISFLIYWAPHIHVMQLKWGKVMRAVTGKLHEKLEEMLGGRFDGAKNGVDLEASLQKLTDMALEEGRDRLEKELNSANVPTVDMVVLICENPGDRERLKEYAERKRGVLFRPDIPVEVLAKNYEGSGNAYFEGFEFVRHHLKNWENAKVVFILYGENGPKNDESIELAVMNAYRGVGAYQGAQHVVVYTRDVYHGPIEPQPLDSDVRLLGENTALSDLSDMGLLLMDAKNGHERVAEIQEKLNVEALKQAARNERAPHIFFRLLQEYDLDNPHLEQFPALVGEISFGPRAVQMFGHVAEELERNPEVRRKLKYLHMTNDVLRVILKSPEEMSGYLKRRFEFDDARQKYPVGREEAKGAVQWFYSLFVNGNPLVMDVFIPHPKAARLSRIPGDKDMFSADSGIL